MSDKVVDEPFDAAEGEVEAAHQKAVSALRAKVQKAKEEALGRLKS